MTAAPTLRRRLRRTRRRAGAAVQLLTVRTRLRVLAALAPEAADRLALDVWCRVPVGAARRMDLRPGAGEVTRLEVPRGGSAVTEAWGSGPPVYLLHGWGGWRGQLGAFVEPLVAAGHRVVAIDVPSHGDADAGTLGRGRGTVMEFMEALEVAVDHHGPAAGVIAHSMGTMAAARAVADGLAVERLVLVAPSHAFAEVLDDFSRLLRPTPRVREHLVATLEAYTGRTLVDFDLESLGDAVAAPTLVLHDRGDRQTPHRVGDAVARTWPDAVLRSTDGLGHHRILADQAVVEAAVGHLVDRVRTA